MPPNCTKSSFVLIPCVNTVSVSCVAHLNFILPEGFRNIIPFLFVIVFNEVDRLLHGREPVLIGVMWVHNDAINGSLSFLFSSFTENLRHTLVVPYGTNLSKKWFSVIPLFSPPLRKQI